MKQLTLVSVSLFLFHIGTVICAQLSSIPEPNGPFYGFPYNTKVATGLPIPATAFGKCEEGAVYTINSTSDLTRYNSELQCVFASAITPSKVPEGPQYGRVLLALNSRHFLINPIVTLLWRGNFAFKAKCNETQDVYIGFHNSFGRAVLPTILYVGPLVGNMAPGEYEDGRGSVIMDFLQDLTKTCKGYDHFVEMNKNTFPTPVRSLINVYPQTQILDVFRLVGKQSDGGKIYLGKTYFVDYYRSDKQMATIAFWYLVNYDEEVNPEFQVGQSLPPLTKTFEYMFPGVVDIVLRFLPFDNFLSRPLVTLWRLGAGIRHTGRASWLKFRDYMRELGSHTANRRRIMQYFREGRKLKAHDS